MATVATNWFLVFREGRCPMARIRTLVVASPWCGGVEPDPWCGGVAPDPWHGGE